MLLREKHKSFVWIIARLEIFLGSLSRQSLALLL